MVLRACIAVGALLLLSSAAWAGGPKYIAGTSYFNAAVTGQPLHWSGGQLNYYVDQGPLSATVSNQQATAMVDAAAALWNAVPTAGVALTDKGQLNEDVNGANILVNSSGTIVAPADVTPSAASYPVAVIYDSDGSVIDAIFGPAASAPGACQNNGVYVWADNFNPDATFAHAVIVLNGRCATTAPLLDMMSFELERAFGRVLGLDASQVNPQALANSEPDGTLGWPIMEPAPAGKCGASGGDCIPDPTLLRYDDIAALNRLYPITAANLARFPGKQITAANTIALTGTVSFANGYGMQGVNMVARPLDADGSPLYQYTVTAVTDADFSGNHGNPVTGFTDSSGNPFTRWGSEDPTAQGFFDLSGIPLPPGTTSATYQISFEAISPLDILDDSVGPYTLGQVTPSGTLSPVTLNNLSAGAAQTLAVTAANSAASAFTDAIGSAAQPQSLPASGMWVGRLGQVGQTDWFTFPVRGARTFTIVTQALDETGETWLRVSASGDDVVRLGVADLRGDGRPDYAYNGWVLYADSVTPARLPASGGPIVIHGMGFHTDDTVMVAGQPALVTSISPNEITAVAPPAPAGVTGSVDVEVDDAPVFYAAAIVTAGISYDAGNGDALSLVTAPANTVPLGVPLPFTVTALGANLTPAGGVTVIYTVTSGTAKLSCGQATCSVTATGDGRASMSVTAIDGTWSVVTAALTNGSMVQAQFAGGTPPTIAALTPQLSLAAGASITWAVQALVEINGAPLAGQSVTWQTPGSGIAIEGAATATTNASGIATETLTVGPLADEQQTSIDACVNGASQCVTFTAFGARPEYAALEAVSGTNQSLSSSGTPSQIVLRVLDMDGNEMAGATVALYQALYAWTPPCSPHAVCAQGALLATQSGTATSAVDGTVTFVPASLPGVATDLVGLAASGNTSTVRIAIEQQ